MFMTSSVVPESAGAKVSPDRRRSDPVTIGPRLTMLYPAISFPQIALGAACDRPEPPNISKTRTSSAMRVFLLILGFFAAALIIGQLVLGQLILSSGHLPRWTTAHRHSGYLTVVVSLLYIGFSLASIASTPKLPRP
jgi:hypothetical protein